MSEYPQFEGCVCPNCGHTGRFIEGCCGSTGELRCPECGFQSCDRTLFDPNAPPKKTATCPVCGNDRSFLKACCGSNYITCRGCGFSGTVEEFGGEIPYAV